MNSLLCEFLKVDKHRRQYDGSTYYSVKVLCEDKPVLCFFNKAELYESLSKIDRMSAIQLIGQYRLKDDRTFVFVPESFEM